MGRNINGILVGCDDEDVGGYEWVIKHNDFDNSNPEIINKLEQYKNIKDFKIYFYVFKTQTEESARTSDKYRGTIFGRAEINKVERNKNDPEKYKYVHHVKIKNFEPFAPKIKLEDIEHKLEKYGWTADQKEHFGVNLSHHGLLLTKKDCDLINGYVSNSESNAGNLDNMEDILMKKREIEMEGDVVISNDYAGLILGHYCRPDRQGYDYVLDTCEDDGRGDKMLTRVKKFKGKKAYFYIYESHEPDNWEPDDWEQFKESNGEKLGRIFGEGLIKDVKNNKIIYQYVTHYHDYIDINEANILLGRIDEINKNKPIKSQKNVKQRLTIGLSLTKDECDQISSLAGVDVLGL